MKGTSRRKSCLDVEARRRRSFPSTSRSAKALLLFFILVACSNFVRVAGGDDSSQQHEKRDEASGRVKLDQEHSSSSSNMKKESYAEATLQKLMSADSANKNGKPEGKKVDPLPVVVLTSRNFDSTVGDGSVWLVEFYAPWCSHCRHFESTYEEIAAHFHQRRNDDGPSSSKGTKPVRVAKVDGDAERALSSRFGVHGYPSFYVVDGWSVYPFELSRSKHNLVRFAERDYKSSSPIPFYSSPMGPLGLAQGTLMAAGMAATDQFERLQQTFGLSPLFAGAVLFGLTFMGCFCLLVFFVVVVTPKSKID